MKSVLYAGAFAGLTAVAIGIYYLLAYLLIWCLYELNIVDWHGKEWVVTLMISVVIILVRHIMRKPGD